MTESAPATNTKHKIQTPKNTHYMYATTHTCDYYSLLKWPSLV